MGENFLTPSRVGWLVGVAVLVLIANVFASILYMVLYGHVIDPGHEKEYYDAHIQVAAPYCSIVAGIPLMFLTSWWVGGWWQPEFAVRSALTVWLAYTVIDITILMLAGGLTSGLASLVGVSVIAKLVAIYFGALFANRSRIGKSALT